MVVPLVGLVASSVARNSLITASCVVAIPSVASIKFIFTTKLTAAVNFVVVVASVTPSFHCLDQFGCHYFIMKLLFLHEAW